VQAAPSARLAAVADVDLERAKALGEKHGCAWYDSLQEMLQSSEVEVVNVCIPSGLHADQGMEAAKEGRHVLLEKPMDRSLAKVNHLISYCRRKGLKLGCVFQCRFSDGPRRLKQAIDEGRLGRLLCGSAEVMWYRTPEYYKSAAWRGTLALDGGCLWNQAVHHIDLLCWLLGKPKKVISAHVATLAHEIEAEDLGIAQVLFRNGAVGLIRASTAAYPGLPGRLEICGTKGSAVLTGDELTYFAVEGQEEEKSEKKADAGAAASPSALDDSGHIAQIQDFAEAIIFDWPPFVDGNEGRASVKLLTEIYRVAGVRLRNA
jgi:predicted dehydrogenase